MIAIPIAIGVSDNSTRPIPKATSLSGSNGTLDSANATAARPATRAIQRSCAASTTSARRYRTRRDSAPRRTAIVTSTLPSDAQEVDERSPFRGRGDWVPEAGVPDRVELAATQELREVEQDDPDHRDDDGDAPARPDEAVSREEREQQCGATRDGRHEQQLRHDERLKGKRAFGPGRHPDDPVPEQEKTEAQPDAGRDHQPRDPGHRTALDDQVAHDREEDHAPEQPDRRQVQADREAFAAGRGDEDDPDALGDGHHRQAGGEPTEPGQPAGRRRVRGCRLGRSDRCA